MAIQTGLTIPFTGLRRQYHELRQEILDITDAVLRSGQLMNGNYTVEFEHWLAKRNHVPYAVTCHSGTQALEIIASYYAQDWHKPTAFIPTMTYVATANAFVNAGWRIHLVDTDSQGILDWRQLPPLAENTAVILIGLYGANVANFDIEKWWSAWHRGAGVILEDAAQHWLARDCERVGSAAAISFDPTKNLANYGNGGAVLTNSSELADFARSWRDNGRLGGHATAATNSRMSEIDCAQLLVKTRHLDRWQLRRMEIARYWIGRLAKTSVRCLITDNTVKHHALQKFVIDVEERNTVRDRLQERRIETRIHYERPLHELPGIFSQCPGPDMLSAASALSRRVLSLPFYPELTDLEVEYIIDQLLDLV